MPTSRNTIWMHGLITLLVGAIAALGIWLLAGQADAAAFGFVIAAVARDAGSSRGCARRALRSAT